MEREVEHHKFIEPAPPLAGTGPSLHDVGHINDDLEDHVVARHRDAVAQYPELSLSYGEYVIEVVRRHPIGLLSIWAVVALIEALVLLIMPAYALNREGLANSLMIDHASLPGAEILALPTLILSALFALGGWLATIVYNGNRFYLTDESIIQFIQTSLFKTQQQIVNLINVEDVSIQQSGIIQQLLNYGTLRVSTQGEDTIYHFNYVRDPRKVVNQINNAAEHAMRRFRAH